MNRKFWNSFYFSISKILSIFVLKAGYERERAWSRRRRGASANPRSEHALASEESVKTKILVFIFLFM
ncbi:MAG: hypothetical protein AAB958_01665, partial [Patescibacteria group bacterium]